MTIGSFSSTVAGLALPCMSSVCADEDDRANTRSLGGARAPDARVPEAGGKRGAIRVRGLHVGAAGRASTSGGAAHRDRQGAGHAVPVAWPALRWLWRLPGEHGADRGDGLGPW